MKEKQQIRSYYLQLRKNLTSLRREEASFALRSFLEKNVPNGKVLSFYSLPEEICIHSWNQKLCEEKRLVLPKVTGSYLSLYLVTDLSKLARSSWSLLEPSTNSCTLINPEELSYALIPGIAFDANHTRIGFGKGYYDKLLPKLSCPTLGIGFLEQYSKKTLPQESFDAKTDLLALF